MTSEANGFTMPPLELSEGFDFMPEYDELMDQIASTNVIDADWPILRDMIKYKIAENIKAYLALGPPWPMLPEEAFLARTGANEALDGFPAPPFTIQRLCELALDPRKHYTSLPKYLRALTRVLTVSSTRSSSDEDDSTDAPHASTSAVTLDHSIPPPLAPNSTTLPSPTLPTRRPAVSRSPASSPRALPVVVPLLSPIPWLVKDKDDDLESVDEMDLSSEQSSPPVPRRTSFGSSGAGATGLSFSPPQGEKPTSPTLNATQTPTGGLVDEVDPGSGGAETTEPVALSSTSYVGSPPSSGDGSLEVPEVVSLRERFVRASSPRVERSVEEEKGSEGAMETGEA